MKSLLSLEEGTVRLMDIPHLGGKQYRMVILPNERLNPIVKSCAADFLATSFNFPEAAAESPSHMMKGLGRTPSPPADPTL